MYSRASHSFLCARVPWGSCKKCSACSVDLGWAQGSSCLTSSLVMLGLWVHQPHFEQRPRSPDLEGFPSPQHKARCPSQYQLRVTSPDFLEGRDHPVKLKEWSRTWRTQLQGCPGSSLRSSRWLSGLPSVYCGYLGHTVASWEAWVWQRFILYCKPERHSGEHRMVMWPSLWPTR